MIFDWRGTLATTLSGDEWVREALRSLGRPAEPTDVEAVSAANGDENRLDGPGVDSDAGLHRRTFLSVFADAGLDDELAQALYAVESDLRYNPFADDVTDTLTELHRRGLRLGVVSDIHVDLRPAFASAGLAEWSVTVPGPTGLRSSWGSPRCCSRHCGEWPIADSTKCWPSAALMLLLGGLVANEICEVGLPRPDTPDFADLADSAAG